MGSGKESTPRILGASVNFCQISFWSKHSYEKKSRWRKKTRGKKGKQAGVGVDEMQNKAKAQPAWLQLATGAAAGA